MSQNKKSDRFGAVDLKTFPVGNNAVLGYSELAQAGQILSGLSMKLLQSCRKFETFEVLKQKCYQSLFPSHKQVSSEQLTQVEEALNDLLASGLLISQEDILSHTDLELTQDSPKVITTLGFVTKNRIASLSACIQSYIKLCKKFGREMSFVVYDGSENLKTQKDCKDLLEDLQKNYNIQIFYAGFEERKNFIHKMVEEGIPEYVANFALLGVKDCHPDTGVNRNAMILDTVGEMVFSVDDDTRSEVIVRDGGAKKINIASGVFPHTLRIFPDQNTALKNVIFSHQDILSLHESVLGKTVEECVTNALVKDVQLENLNADLVRRLRNGTGSIRATCNGLVGDCGWGWARHLFAPLEKIHQDIESKKKYLVSIRSRSIAYCPDHITIGDASFCMSYSIGLDNRHILPPFMPIYRAQDSIFGILFWKCFKDDFFGQLPLSILHTPPEVRHFHRNDVWNNVPPRRFNDIIQILISNYHFPYHIVEPSERLRDIGRYLSSLGEISLPEFEQHLHLLWCQEMSKLISLCERRLKRQREKPVYWAQDVKKLIENLRQRMCHYSPPDELKFHYKGPKARQLAQQFVTLFGDLLKFWPDIINISKKMRKDGQRLAIHI